MEPDTARKEQGSISDALPISKQERIVALVIAVLLFLFATLVAGVPDSTNVMQYDPEKLVAADISWVIVASCLVLFMTPGLAFFYGGMVQRKNIISTLIQSYICLAAISILWIIYGFSLVFGEDKGGVIGSPHTYFFYKNVGASPHHSLGTTIPLTLFSLFQLYFAVITPALISGSYSERVNFYAYVFFVCLWFTFVYCPLAHATWTQEGILFKWGVLDFAGGTVVHLSAGFSALVGSWVLGPRYDDGSRHQPAHIPYVLLGTAMLWFGWIGFNGGSALSASPLAVHAFLTTNTGAATSMIMWLLVDIIKGKRISAVGGCSGAVVGLVVVTPGCGFVTVGGAMCMCSMSSIICNIVAQQFKRLDLDDTLDVFACHGVGGACGMFFLGFFATNKVNSAVIYEGVLYGGSELIWKHIVSIIGVISYVMVVSYCLYKLADVLLGLRVSNETEIMGMDRALHGESTDLLSKLQNVTRKQFGTQHSTKSNSNGPQELRTNALPE